MDNEDINNHQELLIEPNPDVIKKRMVNFVVMDKQVGREEKKHLDDDEYYVNNEEYKEILDPSQKRIIAYDFGKQEDRFKVDRLKDLGIEQDELIIEDNLPARVVKGAVRMDVGMAGDRFKEPLNKDPFYED